MSDLRSRMVAALRNSARVLVKRFGHEIGTADLAAPAIVFAPHPDDETLGCGGTIIRKKLAGARLTAVFMTDGSASHARFLPREELRRMRREEAIAACGVLGIAGEDVIFLDFEDGRLQQFHEEAVRAVCGQLRQSGVQQVFVPYAGDTTPDHKATRSAVLEALKRSRAAVTIYEYPVWFWGQWPWASQPVYSRQDLAIKTLNALVCWSRALKDLRWSVGIGDVLETKRAALERHRTQTQRLVPGSAWPVLSDISGGEFLDCFFQQEEVFYRHNR